MSDQNEQILKIQEVEKRREMFKTLSAIWGPVRIGELYQGGVEGQVTSQN